MLNGMPIEAEVTNLINKVQGSIVAVVTPMHEDKSIDFSTFKNLLDWHVEQGTNAIIVAGTTGESATIDVQEHCELIKVAVDHINKRIPVIAGTGGNSTTEAIELTTYAKKVGADASLQVVPYYNKPSQEGMYDHFIKIANAVEIPIILYNVPGRTAADMQNETVIKLLPIENIMGIKDATGNIERGTRLINMLEQTSYKHKFNVYSGDDATAAMLILLGAKGNMTVTGNILPYQVQQIANNCIRYHDLKNTLALNKDLSKINSILFCEANPIPVKYCLHKMNKIKHSIRLPLTNLSDKFIAEMDEELSRLKLI